MADLYSGAGGGGGAMAVVKGDMGGPNRRDFDLDGSLLSTRVVMLRLLALLRSHRGLLAASFLANVAAVITQLYVPVLIGHAIDQIVGVGQVDFAGLRVVIGRLAFVIPASVLLGWIAGTATNRLGVETARDLRDRAYETFRTLPFSFLDTHAQGDLLSRVVNDADVVGDGLQQLFAQLFSGIVTIVGTLCFMFYLAPMMCVAVIVMTPLSMCVAAGIARLSSASFADAQRLTGQLTGYVNEMVSNQALVSAFGRGKDSTRQFGSINADLRGAGERSQFVSSLSNPTTRLVNNVTYAVVAITGCVIIITALPSPLTIGELQSFLTYTNQFMKPFNEISGVVSQLQAAIASARRIFVLLDAERETEEGATARLSRPIQGDIEFSHVNFSYVSGHPILSDVSFHARPGERFALVGPTGCGKTTLINVLMRFYEVQGGQVLVDGVDTATLARDDLRDAFGMVLQETWLESGTIADNIRFGRPEASDEEVHAAAERAHAHKFIMQLPQGYDTVIDEAGQSLSQGQRQLLSIARVMLADRRILLLDEATSSIDTRTEMQVQDAFDRMMEGRTSLVVAHRLSTIRGADCILVMDAGRIVERGTHEELLARDGFYARLYRSQWES